MPAEAVTQEVISGWAGLMAVAGVVLSQAWTAYKSNKIDKASGGAQLDMINRLSDQLDKERDATKVANERADRFAQERNDMTIVIGELRGEIRAMRGQIETLTSEVAELKGTPHVQAIAPQV
jgi:hypothetical protein